MGVRGGSRSSQEPLGDVKLVVPLRVPFGARSKTGGSSNHHVLAAALETSSHQLGASVRIL